jgi:hypothetical protein
VFLPTRGWLDGPKEALKRKMIKEAYSFSRLDKEKED